MENKVKTIEKSRILSTKDYAMFTLRDVKISKPYLDEIKESITKKNLSKDYPILVDNDYNIIEGKYRYLALYDLRLPIFYKISEVTDLKDALTVKYFHKNAPIEDIIFAFIDLPSYSNLFIIKEKFNGFFSLKNIANSASIQHGEKYRCQYTWYIDRKKFHTGEFENWDINQCIHNLNSIKYIMEFFNCSFGDACSNVATYFDYDIDKIIIKLPVFNAIKKANWGSYGWVRYKNLMDILETNNYNEYYITAEDYNDLLEIGIKSKLKVVETHADYEELKKIRELATI